MAEFATIACFGLGVALLSFVPFNFWSRIYNKIPSNLLKGIIVFSLIPLGISFLWTSYSAISFPGNVLIFTFWMKTFYLFGPPQYYSVDIESAFFFFTALFAMFLLYFRKSGAIKGAVRSLELAIFILTCLCVNLLISAHYVDPSVLTEHMMNFGPGAFIDNIALTYGCVLGSAPLIITEIITRRRILRGKELLV